MKNPFSNGMPASSLLLCLEQPAGSETEGGCLSPQVVFSITFNFLPVERWTETSLKEKGFYFVLTQGHSSTSHCPQLQLTTLATLRLLSSTCHQIELLTEDQDKQCLAVAKTLPRCKKPSWQTSFKLTGFLEGQDAEIRKQATFQSNCRLFLACFLCSRLNVEHMQFLLLEVCFSLEELFLVSVILPNKLHI